MNDREISGKLPRGEGTFLSWRSVAPETPRATGVMFLGGFNSDMTGTKAGALADWALAAERNFLRFDYYGHGTSFGEFHHGTISRWLEDSLAALDELTEGGQVLVGSSMGGWLALLCALARPERIKGLVLIAPAADFTEALMWAGFSAEIRRQIMEEGAYFEPSQYGADYPITRELIEDGRKHLILGKPIGLDIPIRILQGMQDEDVPHAHAMRLVQALRGDDVTLTLIKGGDHRLSTPADLQRLTTEVEMLLQRLEA